MRLYELLSENTQQKMKADLMSLLLSLKASKGDQLPTRMVVSQMNKLGYSITMDSVIPFITQLPIVQSADATTIALGSQDEIGDQEGMSDDEADQMTMDNLADKGVKGMNK